MTDQNKHEKERVFERFPLGFLVEVTGTTRSGKAFSDIGNMRDVSGSGLCFSTAHADSYAVGQKVVIHVRLPGTDELDASMTSDATVIWIHCSDQQHGGKEEKALIGMAMDGCMAFETRNLRQSEDSSS